MADSLLTCESSFDTYFDQDEINQAIINKLNSILGSDIKNLKKVILIAEELKTVKKELEKELLFATTEAPNQISKSLISIEGTQKVNETLNKDFLSLQEQIKELELSSKPLIEVFEPHQDVILEGEQIEIYRKWIFSIEELSQQIESSIKTGSDDVAFGAYNKLKESGELICRSECHQLKQYTCEKISQWHQCLLERFQQEFSNVLKKVNWPFLSSIKQPPIPSEHLERLEQLTQYLLNLELPSCISQVLQDAVASPPLPPKETSQEEPTLMPSLIADFKVSLLPLQLLLKPLEIRFLYHFSGNKVTNSRENPEWYLTQIIKWISNHEAFLETQFQPLLDKNGLSDVIAKNEFMKGLLRLVMLKLSSDLPEIQKNEDLFCETIQETLNFERELRLSLNYPPNLPSILIVLTQANIFSKWISLEQKFALELMDEFVSSNLAWQPEETGGLAHCGEQLILILQGITDRYKPLPQPGHRLQFLDLQVDLLDDFRVRILQMTKSELPDLLQSNYASILNTVYHISSTLTDWCDLPFFIEMQFFKEKFGSLQNNLRGVHNEGDSLSISNFVPTGVSQCIDDVSADYSINASFVSTVLPRDGHFRQNALTTLNLTASKPSASDLLEVNGFAFEEMIQLYSHIEMEMLSNLCKHVLTEVQARSQGYRRNKWFLGHEHTARDHREAAYEISPAFCPLLEILIRNLHVLKDILASQLFVKLWQSIAQGISKFIYEEVILQNTFSEKGAAQLEHDLTKGLFPIFGEYTPKPDAHFSLLKEILILLVLTRPAALLLRDTLKMAHEGEKDFSCLGISPVQALEEQGIFGLSVQEAEILLNIRTNMGK